MMDSEKTEKAEGKPQGKPKSNDVVAQTECYYNGRRIHAGTIIPNFQRKLKAYGKTVPTTEAGKYEKIIFNGEPKLRLRKKE